MYTLDPSVQFSRSVVSYSLRPHESQHTRPPCPSPTPGVHSNSRSSSRWSHPAISSSVVPFSSCPQSLPSSESFPRSQLFAWGGQSTGVSASASFLPKNTQGWSPSEWTSWISLQSKGLSRVFSNTTVHQFFSRVQFFVTLCTVACQVTCLLATPSLLKLMSIQSMMPYNHLILCCPLLLLPLILPSTGGFSRNQFFTSGGQSLQFQLQYQSFHWIFRTDFL